MAKTKNLDRNLISGPIYPVLLSVALPMIINNIIMSLYNLADGLWLAQLSMLDFTATSFVWPPHSLFLSIGMGISVAGTAIIAQLLGQNDIERSEEYASHLFIMSVIIGISLSGVGYFAAPSIVRFMGAEGALAEKSNIYLSILLIGYFFDMVYMSYNAVLAAQGKTKITTIIGTASSVLNVILDPILIFERIPFIGLPGLNMGIAGAAWATVIAQLVKVILGYKAVKSPHNKVTISYRGVSYRAEYFKELIKTGLPTALGQASSAIGFTLLNSVIVAYGEATMTAYATVNRISGFLMMPAMGIGNALTAIIGQNFGAGYKDRVKEFIKAGFIVSTSMAIVGGLIQWFARYPLLSVFLKEGQVGHELVWSQAIEYSLYSALITPLMAFFDLFGGIFNGSGYPSYTASIAMGRLWFVRLPLIYLFQRFSTMGSKAVWIAMLLSNLIIDIYGFYLFYKRKWFYEPRIDH